MHKVRLRPALLLRTAEQRDNVTDKDSDKPSTAMTAMKEVKKEPLVVPSGTSITVSLGSAIGSKVSQAGQTFSGSVSKEVLVGGVPAIPKGATVSGTVTDAKPLGKFAGGAELQVRLDTITLKGVDFPVQVSIRTFSAKGKGKRTAVIPGGGAALGGIIGALAGGGKGAAMGLKAGGGAGAGGAAFTGNKDIVLPAESALTFVLSQSFTVNSSRPSCQQLEGDLGLGRSGQSSPPSFPHEAQS